MNLLVLIGGVNERDVRQTSVCRRLSESVRNIALDKLKFVGRRANSLIAALYVSSRKQKIRNPEAACGDTRQHPNQRSNFKALRLTVPAHDACSSGAGSQQVEENSDRCSLAGAVQAEKPEHFTLSDFKLKVFYGRQSAITL